MSLLYMISDISLQISWIESKAFKNQFNIKSQIKQQIKKKLVSVLKLLGVSGSYVLEVELIPRIKIQELNREYRNKNQSTDVLSFPTYIKFSDTQNTQVLGTIFICLDYVLDRDQATLGLDSEKLQELVIHGFIHTLGFDHKTDSETWKNLEKNIK
ncbi:MAG: rRNA maturation RNase YbeY [bacterium]